MRSKTEPPCAINGDEYEAWRREAKEYRLKWEIDFERRQSAIERAKSKISAMSQNEKIELIKGIFVPVESFLEEAEK